MQNTIENRTEKEIESNNSKWIKFKRASPEPEFVNV
jgi:hypothetical protein